jgi:phosphoribosylanthranilate isomerase
MLKTNVLAGPVDHLTDARYFAAWEVARLSFALDAQPADGMSPAKLAALREWISGPEIVGVFTITPLADVLTIAAQCELQGIQLGPFYDAEAAKELAAAGWVVLKEIIVEGYSVAADIETILREHSESTTATILSFGKGGITYEDLLQGTPLTLDQLRQWCRQYPILLELNASSRTAAEILEELQPVGFAVRGGEEEQVGVKNFDELDAFFESLEVFV